VHEHRETSMSGPVSHAERPTAPTSIEKALDVCEALSQAPDGHSVSELVRLLKQPPATVHRLLSVLKRRGYVQQDEETSR
jgi:DNA-binding IclR family transcriptional regulator